MYIYIYIHIVLYYIGLYCIMLCFSFATAIASSSAHDELATCGALTLANGPSDGNGQKTCTAFQGARNESSGVPHAASRARKRPQSPGSSVRCVGASYAKCIYIYIYIHTYIHIYSERERETHTHTALSCI